MEKLWFLVQEHKGERGG